MRGFKKFFEGHFEIKGATDGNLEHFEKLWQYFLPKSGLPAGKKHKETNNFIRDWIAKELFGDREKFGRIAAREIDWSKPQEEWKDWVDKQHLYAIWNKVGRKILRNYSNPSLLEKMRDKNYDTNALLRDEDFGYSDGSPIKHKDCVKVELRDNQRIHYSKDDLSLKNIRTIKQHVGNKPHGFWYACDNSWYYRCKELLSTGGLDLDWDLSLKHKYVITIDMSKIIRLENDANLEKFTKTYRDGGWDFINWDLVAKTYGGVECCPYFTNLGEKYRWYKNWDIPSGCVWDKSVILDIKKIH
jgi:hypothetical protein